MMPHLLIALLCLLINIEGICSVSKLSKVVITSNGKVKGYELPGHGVMAFYGIPYGTVPKGEDRFQAPLPARSWKGIFEATNSSIQCPRPRIPLHSYKYPSIEECLVINVFTPIPLPIWQAEQYQKEYQGERLKDKEQAFNKTNLENTLNVSKIIINSNISTSINKTESVNQNLKTNIKHILNFTKEADFNVTSTNLNENQTLSVNSDIESNIIKTTKLNKTNMKLNTDVKNTSTNYTTLYDSSTYKNTTQPGIENVETNKRSNTTILTIRDETQQFHKSEKKLTKGIKSNEPSNNKTVNEESKNNIVSKKNLDLIEVGKNITVANDNLHAKNENSSVIKTEANLEFMKETINKALNGENQHSTKKSKNESINITVYKNKPDSNENDRNQLKNENIQQDNSSKEKVSRDVYNSTEDGKTNNTSVSNGMIKGIKEKKIGPDFVNKSTSIKESLNSTVSEKRQPLPEKENMDKVLKENPIEHNNSTALKDKSDLIVEIKNNTFAKSYIDSINSYVKSNHFINKRGFTNINRSVKLELQPVLVVIHGGGYTIGRGTEFVPAESVRQNIIVVSFNYRLGILGFLCMQSKRIPGNAGIKDVLAALRWVKENISAFGGDPNDVTIAGYDTGANLVDLLVLIPAAKGLFMKAISDSGTNTLDITTQLSPNVLAQNLAFEMTGKNLTITFLEKFYTNLTVKQIEQTPLNLYNTPGPCIDGEFAVNPILVEEPFKTIRKGNYSKVPFLTGFTNREAKAYMQHVTEFKDNLVYNDELEFPLQRHNDSIEQNLRDNTKKFYFGNDVNKMDKYMFRETYLDFFTDKLFVHPTYMKARYHARYSKVFLYEFAYEGSLKLVECNNRYGGACHYDHVLYIQNFDNVPGYDRLTTRDLKMQAKLIKLWTNFVKYGNPTPKRTRLLPVKWLPLTARESNYMLIDTYMRMKTTPKGYRMELFDRFYDID